MGVELTSAYGAWCDLDPEGECDFMGPFGHEQEAARALREHHSTHDALSPTSTQGDER